MNTWKRFVLLLPFWVYVIFFKFGASLHYSLLSWLGGQVLPLWIVGLLVGVGSFLQLMLDVPTGYLLDRFGYVRIMQIGSLIFVVAGLMLSLGISANAFYITMILSSLGWLAFGPGANAYVLSSAPRGEGGKYMGLYHVMASLGVVLSAVGVVVCLQMSVAFNGLFIASLLFISLLALFFAPNPKHSVHHEVKTIHHHYYIRRHFFHHLFKKIRNLSPAFTVLTMQYFVGSIFYAAIWFVIPLMLARQIHDSTLGFGLSIFDLSIVLLGTYLGKLADKLNSKRLALLGLFVFALMSLGASFNLNIWFLLFGFLATAGDELSDVSLWSWINRLERKHDQDGSLSGIASLAGDFGYAVGPILAGALYEIVGAEWTIAICSLPILILWVSFSFSTFIRNRLSMPPLPNEMPERLYRFRHKH